MNIVDIKLELIKPYENNPRINDDAILPVMESIKEFGFKVPIVLDKDYVIINGHTRFEASKLIGLNEVPCIIAKDLSDEQVKAFRLADNKVGEIAMWDDELLKLELESIEDIEMESFGFEIDDIDIDDDEEEDFSVPSEKELDKVNAVTQLNDLWVINHRHFILCGNSEDKESVDRLLGINNISMVFTDPPYNYKTMGKGGGSLGEPLAKLTDNIKEIINFAPDKFLDMLQNVFEKDMNAYIFCNTQLVPDYCMWARENGYNFNILTWHKVSFIPANGGHHFPDTEYLIYISRKATFNTGLIDVNYGKYWVEDKENSSDHPTIKPTSIIKNEILISSNKDDFILDLYGGSGSTMIACEMTNRKTKIIEQSPAYCDVMIKRFANKFDIESLTLNGVKMDIESTMEDINGKP